MVFHNLSVQLNKPIQVLNHFQTYLDQADSIALEAQSEIRASEGFARARGNVDLI